MNEMAGVYNASGQHPIVLVCEHASAYMPEEYNHLGLHKSLLRSHIAWDPGAMAVATYLADHFDSPLVHSKASRLLYDCNRPPEADSAVTTHSEQHTIPGNAGLTQLERNERATRFYQPFKTCLQNTIKACNHEPVIVTMHSFTPIYNGQVRKTELGVLHDSDARLADALLACAKGLQAERNQPYGPKDGVTHTLQEHAVPNGYLNAMLEVRNDLIRTDTQQKNIAMALADWICKALSALGVQSIPTSAQRTVPL